MAKLIKQAKRGPIQVELTVQEQDILASLIYNGVYGRANVELAWGDNNLLTILKKENANLHALEIEGEVGIFWSEDYDQNQ